VGFTSLADDQQLTYWAQRYVVRSDPTYAGAPADPTAFDGGGLDVPAFLWPCREAILTTGGRLGAQRGWACCSCLVQCHCSRSRTVYLSHYSCSHTCTPYSPAGKYLNAMRECGAAVPPSPLPNGRLQYDAGGAYLDAIRTALDAASGALLRLMLGQGQLMGWLRSIKHFFLLDQVGTVTISPQRPVT
jgi:hypothetical protein